MVVVTFLCFVNNLNVEVVNLIAILFTSIESSFHNTYARNLMTIRASAGIVTLYSIGVLAIFSGCLGVFVGMFIGDKLLLAAIGEIVFGCLCVASAFAITVSPGRLEMISGATLAGLSGVFLVVAGWYAISHDRNWGSVVFFTPFAMISFVGCYCLLSSEVKSRNPANNEEHDQRDRRNSTDKN